VVVTQEVSEGMDEVLGSLLTRDFMYVKEDLPNTMLICTTSIRLIKGEGEHISWTILASALTVQSLA